MKLSGINQLWVADITYIRLRAEFVYLAVILDAFSRQVVGWALSSIVYGVPVRDPATFAGDASTMGGMTPDSFYKDSHVGDPQSWNEYAYARNNPLTAVDSC